MQKIVPHLWFDTEAVAAANFYTALFPNSAITATTQIHNTPSGDCDVVSFDLSGYSFMAISAGPVFRINPSISFHYRCSTTEEVEMLWAKLSPGGIVRMELGEYPFSKRYGWIEDRFGVSWQLIYSEAPFTQRIVPVLMFTQSGAGKAESAIASYASIFTESSSTVLARYMADEGPDKEGTIKYAQFTLAEQEFGAMDSARSHDFVFNEAISFLVRCDSQEEIDFYWSKLSAVPEAEQCGWLKDAFGVSWQIVPTLMDEIMKSGDREVIDRVMQVVLPMKKFDLAKLQEVSSEAA